MRDLDAGYPLAVSVEPLSDDILWDMELDDRPEQSVTRFCPAGMDWGALELLRQQVTLVCRLERVWRQAMEDERRAQADLDAAQEKGAEWIATGASPAGAEDGRRLYEACEATRKAYRAAKAQREACWGDRDDSRERLVAIVLTLFPETEEVPNE